MCTALGGAPALALDLADAMVYYQIHRQYKFGDPQNHHILH